MRIGAAAPGRTPIPGRTSALEKAIRGFAEYPGDNVIVPTLGASFDSLSEAYDFYNLYSWEKGFGIRLTSLLAPKKRKEMGWPTTSREKAPYEGLNKRTRFCTICRQQGHKRTTCPDRGDIPKPVCKPARCKNCGTEGHRRNKCKRVGDLWINNM